MGGLEDVTLVCNGRFFNDQIYIHMLIHNLSDGPSRRIKVQYT